MDEGLFFRFSGNKRQRILEMYQAAVKESCHFYSFGDAMIIL